MATCDILKELRQKHNLTQEELAERSSVAVSTIRRIEAGHPVSIQLFISILRTLGMLENLDLLIPETRVSPLQLQKLQGRKVQRVRTKKE